MTKRPPRGSGRGEERVKSARQRKASSQRWLARQLNDPYVRAAKQEGFRSRAAHESQAPLLSHHREELRCKIIAEASVRLADSRRTVRMDGVIGHMPLIVIEDVV